MRIAINGFGRIGRCLLRAVEEETGSPIEVAVINSPSDPRILAHLLKYDSTYGTLPYDVGWKPDAILVRGTRIPCINEPDNSEIDWSAFNIDLLIDCSGQAKEREASIANIENGAPRVLISAPSHDPDITLIPGCNLDSFNPTKHRIVSMGSCTLNCICPTLKVLRDSFGVRNGFATAIHSYTSDQRLLDGSHDDLRRARAAGESLIPTKTGASQALSSVFPELKGKIQCAAIRTPTSTVSLLDLVVQSEKEVGEKTINEAFGLASISSLKGIVAVSDSPLVSIDYKKDPHSVTIDALSTSTTGNMVRVLAWYDNEWAYSLRLVDTALVMCRSQNERPITKLISQRKT
jgi:glyceraldehyde-3-phosphate dehydrogenase (NAD(P)+) (phosphorylating)